MGRRKRSTVSKQVSRPDADAPERDEAATSRIIERPDGFYWESKEDRTEHGPFATLAEAEADLLSGGVSAEAQDGDGLQEAESELGIAEWIDPDTGGPAEDSVPRIEDH